MSNVHFAFQEGFSDDTVVVSVNGKEVVRKTGLQSQLTVAVADAANVPLEPTSGTVVVDVPTRGISNAFEVDFKEYPYLGISIAGSSLTVKRSREPFEYM